MSDYADVRCSERLFHRLATEFVWNFLPEAMRDPRSEVFCGQLQTVAEYVFISTVSVCSAH